MSIIYDIDTEKPYTPKDVRDAMVKCFYLAHKEVLEEVDQDINMPQLDKDIAHQINIEFIVKKAFEDAKANWENPTKEDIINACGNLAEFANNFRNQEIIKKHYGEIMELVNKL